MPKFFVESSQIKDNKIVILGQDVNHIKNVLRKTIGNNIEICNKDNSQNYLAEITSINKEKIECKTIKIIENNTESNIDITIFQGLPKSDKMELIIQKSVELGATRIVPVSMKRCVVKLSEKDEQKKIVRWQKIAEVASKQCGRSVIPKIGNVVKVKDICDLILEYDVIFVAYENEEENKLKSELKKIKTCLNEKTKIAIVIGPEGGLEFDEVQSLKKNGAKVITLGKRILRTETVALNMISIINYELES